MNKQKNSTILTCKTKISILRLAIQTMTSLSRSGLATDTSRRPICSTKSLIVSHIIPSYLFFWRARVRRRSKAIDDLGSHEPHQWALRSWKPRHDTARRITNERLTQGQWKVGRRRREQRMSIRGEFVQATGPRRFINAARSRTWAVNKDLVAAENGQE